MADDRTLAPELLNALWHVVALSRDRHWGDVTLRMEDGRLKGCKTLHVPLVERLPAAPTWFVAVMQKISLPSSGEAL